MRTKLLFLCAFLCTMLVGCAANQAPQITYEDTSRPLKDTAVILTERIGNGYDLKITHVNEKQTSCIQVGCPVWVRVAPGQHKVTLRYQGDYRMNLREITYFEASVNADLIAEAGHVYIAEYKIEDKRLYVRFRDDGKNSNAGVYLGLSQQKYPAKFE